MLQHFFNGPKYVLVQVSPDLNLSLIDLLVSGSAIHVAWSACCSRVEVANRLRRMMKEKEMTLPLIMGWRPRRTDFAFNLVCYIFLCSYLLLVVSCRLAGIGLVVGCIFRW